VRYADHARFDWQFVPRPEAPVMDRLRLAYSAAGFEKIEKIRDQQNHLHEKQNQDPPHCCGNPDAERDGLIAASSDCNCSAQRRSALSARMTSTRSISDSGECRQKIEN